MMTRELIRRRTRLDPSERAFLRSREADDRKVYYRLIRYCLILAFIIPFIIAWVRALGGKDDPFSYLYYFLGVGFLILFSGLWLSIAYFRFLYKIQKDIRDGYKMVEQTKISRKQFMPHNNKYYLYLHSPTRLSIEVEEADFHAWQEGDEINIEYTPHSLQYLGYF